MDGQTNWCILLLSLVTYVVPVPVGRFLLCLCWLLSFILQEFFFSCAQFNFFLNPAEIYNPHSHAPGLQMKLHLSLLKDGRLFWTMPLHGWEAEWWPPCFSFGAVRPSVRLNKMLANISLSYLKFQLHCTRCRATLRCPPRPVQPLSSSLSLLLWSVW